MEERYRVRTHENHARLRTRLESVRHKLTDVEATASSTDGMVTATVDGQGRLVRLELHPRVFRTLPTAMLSDAIMATTHRAAEHAARRAHDLATEELTCAWTSTRSKDS
jgi:DNA-binding protein YbaB